MIMSIKENKVITDNGIFSVDDFDLEELQEEKNKLTSHYYETLNNINMLISYIKTRKTLKP